MANLDVSDAMKPTPTRRPYNLRCPACDALNPIVLRPGQIVHGNCVYCAVQLYTTWSAGAPRARPAWQVVVSASPDGDIGEDIVERAKEEAA